MERVSTADAARQLGVSGQTIRRWLASGRLRGVRDNHGNILVEIDATPVAISVPTTATSVATHVAEPVIPLSQAMAMVEAERARHDAETARRLAERDSLHLDTLGRLQAQAALERALWLERIDAAEIRAERVEQRLDQVLDVLLNERRQTVQEAKTELSADLPTREPWWGCKPEPQKIPPSRIWLRRPSYERDFPVFDGWRARSRGNGTRMGAYGSVPSFRI